MVGGISQMREIVKEGEIYKRERLVNLKILPYVMSKIWVAALLAFYQAAVYTIVHFLAFDMPGGVAEFCPDLYHRECAGHPGRHDAGFSPPALAPPPERELRSDIAGHHPDAAADRSKTLLAGQES
jgi:hypothetical protein